MFYAYDYGYKHSKTTTTDSQKHNKTSAKLVNYLLS